MTTKYKVYGEYIKLSEANSITFCITVRSSVGIGYLPTAEREVAGFLPSRRSQMKMYVSTEEVERRLGSNQDQFRSL